MNPPATACLILGCGNMLRGDDGVGPMLCCWAKERFAGEPRVRIIAQQQWTPELALDISAAGSVIFVDCSMVSEPGIVAFHTVVPAQCEESRATHEISAAELLALAQVLYGHAPAYAILLTIGAGSTDLGERFSSEVQEAFPAAQEALEHSVRQALESSFGSTQR